MDHSRTTTWDDPIALGQSARELAGIDFLQRLIDEARMEDREGNLYAFATSTCLILEP